MDVRNARVEKTIKTFDESVEFDFELVRPNHCAVDGRVERRCVSAGRQDANALHYGSLATKKHKSPKNL